MLAFRLSLVSYYTEHVKINYKRHHHDDDEFWFNDASIREGHLHQDCILT